VREERGREGGSRRRKGRERSGPLSRAASEKAMRGRGRKKRHGWLAE